MSGPQVELTEIQRFYKNSTVFLTGATGFIGKLFLEKVLRALPVKKVFILVRTKKDVPAAKRFHEIFESPAFDPLKRSNPESFKKVFIIEGDASLPGLGLSPEDKAQLIKEVNVIFHCAASVRFEEHIKKATFTNVRCTKDLIEIAKEIPKFKTFVYVGTAFSNSNKLEIKEEIYPAKISAEKLIAACESLEDDALEQITRTLIGDWPNTYTFTKQVIEDYINREARGIPICIARPSIVISTMSEPIDAFVDNVFTLAGFVLGNALGITRISYYKNTNLDIVPADLVVNECIAAGWQTGENFTPHKSEVPVFNISTVQDNPITQDEVYSLIDLHAKKIPSPKQILYPLYFRTSCKYNYLFLRIFMHTMAAYLIDMMLRFQGKKPMFVVAIEKLHKFQESYEFFSTTQFFHHVENSHKMLKKMSYQDREIFNFDVKTINWENYFAQYPKGLRTYILKDPMNTIPEGRKRWPILKYTFITAVILGSLLLYTVSKVILFVILPFVFKIFLYLIRSATC